MLRSECGADGLGAVLCRGGAYGDLVGGAIMHAVVIGAVLHTAADSVDMLGNLVKGYFVHFKFLPFLDLRLLSAKI